MQKGVGPGNQPISVTSLNYYPMEKAFAEKMFAKMLARTMRLSYHPHCLLSMKFFRHCLSRFMSYRP